jgi:hypothetical protein
MVPGHSLEREMAETEKSFLPTHNEYVSLERQVLQDNIILCDTKCGILLGFSAIVLLWCVDKVPTLSDKMRVAIFPTLAEAIFYTFAILALLVTIAFTWKVIRPRIRQSDDYIYWGSKVFERSEADFSIGIQEADQEVLASDMIRHLHILARVCRDKFANFRRAVIAAELSAVFVLLAVCVGIAANFVRAG